MRTTVLILLSVLALGANAEEDHLGAPCPKVIEAGEDSGTTAPLWVSADRAVGPGHKIDWSLFGESAAKRYETVLLREEAAMRKAGLGSTEHEGGCMNFADSVAPMSGPYAARATAESQVRDSSTIFHGEIVAIDYGFFVGRPGSLLKVSTSEQTKHFVGVDPFPFVYVFFFNGSFDAGEVSYCNRHSLFPYMPEIGDKITVFSGLGGLGEEGRIFLADGFVIFPSDESALVAPSMRNSEELVSATTPYEVDQYVRRVLSTSVSNNDEG